MRNRILILSLSALIACTAVVAQPKREMRGVWIASVSNIDWPSEAAIGHSAMQQLEMIAMLDSLKAAGINMVVFQVRPTADALYRSELEPWSSWLTGKQGEDNNVSYDPLNFVLRQAHQRCMDVHVWINPYRASLSFGSADFADSHVFHKHRDWFFYYGKQWYFDPGLDETRLFLCRVVADLVRRYDIDAIHMDDYFYPYPIKNKPLPDTETFQKHPRGISNIDDWRRNNVNMAIREIHDTIKAIKPWVEFGISPFGIWRNRQNDPRGSETGGLQNYDELYADILLWLEKGWIDYVVPQLYWEIGKKVADYNVLAPWWAEHSFGQNYYVGHSLLGLQNPKAAAPWRTPNEVCRQLRLNNSIEQVQGSVYFSAAGLLKNPQGIIDSLKNDFYRYPALQPIACRESAQIAVAPANAKITKNARDHFYTLKWDAVKADGGQAVAYYVVYAFPEFGDINFDNPKAIIATTTKTSIPLNIDPREYKICITSVNRYKQESLPCVVEQSKM